MGFASLKGTVSEVADVRPEDRPAVDENLLQEVTQRDDVLRDVTIAQP
jgi:hypothetical protein